MLSPTFRTWSPGPDPANSAGSNSSPPNGDRLAAFRIAGVVYQQPVVIEARTTTRALSITVGESFLGVLMPITIGEDRDDEMKEWNAAWSRRLPDPTQPPRGAIKPENEAA
ncbi:hypothetical protein [Rhodococcus pyridinivorans]|uniref:hypothetical protein n=1 Tax=Rhodococcus pyridinivorans TaxID=103816 RepID=UPI003AAFFAB9